ncbi:hypothetical protein ACFSO7_04185 [Bacillus sp. CGMCC 1.16607]|uniref:hypothetical protein n=1 Tax=Bacillus sp. CGMCC 1.16607 TaxID=3351842 RepID=UPI003627C5C1
MEKAIVFETYSFLGFGICKRLLEDGVQVLGLQLFNDDFLDEKKLMIGRNANFEEKSVQDPALTNKDTSDHVLFLSYYDLYFSNDDSTQQSIIYEMINQLQHLSYKKIYLLFPIEFIDRIPSSLLQTIQILQEDSRSISIYLPTLFGPWQSEVFLFQQKFLQEYFKHQPLLNEREYTDDAIYIEDAVEEIISLMYSSEQTDVIFQSDEEEKWIKCAEFLKMDTPKRNNKVIDRKENNIRIVKIKEKNSYQAGLMKQKELLARMIHPMT